MSCHVQKFIAITSLQLGREHNESSIEFELWWKNLSLNGPHHIAGAVTAFPRRGDTPLFPVRGRSVLILCKCRTCLIREWPLVTTIRLSVWTNPEQGHNPAPTHWSFSAAQKPSVDGHVHSQVRTGRHDSLYTSRANSLSVYIMFKCFIKIFNKCNRKGDTSYIYNAV